MTKRHLSPSDARDHEENDNIKRVCSEEASDRYADYIICLHYLQLQPDVLASG